MRKQLCATLVLAMTFLCLPLRAAPQQDTSQPDKAKKCEETAKKRGLKGDDRAAFVSTCMATKDTAEATMSPEDKAKVDNASSCEQQATQKGLKGKDRKDFMKTCKGGEGAPK